MGYLGLILVSLGVILISSLCNKLTVLIWRPYAVTKKFRKQGVKGPGYMFSSGCIDEIRSLETAARETEMDTQSHDITPRVLPHFHKWVHQYGGKFLYWYGTSPRLVITDVELVKQVLSNKSGFFNKVNPDRTILTLLGRGLVLTDGAEWARHRRVVGPAFTMDKLKMMIQQMAECSQSMLDSWQQMVDAIEVNKQFQELTADVISHAAFGSSFVQGKEVFLAQKELQMLFLASANKSGIPGSDYLPTKTNITKWKLDWKMRKTLASIIKSRLHSKEGYGNDLLGLMIESTQKQEGTGLNMNEIIDECKTFFFAGHETTSHLLTWTMFLLSTNPEWQEKLRDEVVRECGMEIPNADNHLPYRSKTA